MNKLYLLIFLIALPCVGKSQNTSTSFFDEYKAGIIILEDGRQAIAPVNFDLLSKKWLYIDRQDRGLIKEIVVDFIYLKVNDSIFVPKYGSLVQLLQSEPLVQVEYEPITRRGAKQLTYGGTTQTAAVDTYSGLRGGGLISGQNTCNRSVVGFNYIYEVEVDGRNKRFSNPKNLVKLFKKEKREEMSKVIESEKLDFSSTDEVLEFLRKYVFTQE